jgi:hypothetical protein
MHVEQQGDFAIVTVKTEVVHMFYMTCIHLMPFWVYNLVRFKRLYQVYNTPLQRFLAQPQGNLCY